MAGKKAHFIGIAGMGMSAVAILLKEQGWRVSGSDTEVYPPATTQLERHGIPYKTHYDPANIPTDADLIVIGKNAKLTRENNVEVRAAHESGKRIASFPEVLAEVTEGRETIVIAGSYGKSTTASLVAWLLSRTGVDAGWFVGAAPQNMEPAHLGTHPVFVLEGDEYPTSHDDPQPKFAHYHAHDALVTAATHDHVNVYKTPEEFLGVFKQLAGTLPADGTLILCGDELNVLSLQHATKARVVTYGLHDAEWTVQHVHRGNVTTFDLVHEDMVMAQLSTELIGDHNVQNIVGACAFVLEKRLVTPEKLAVALSEFKGLARRLDKKTTHSSVPAYEGFGSSREKLRAAIAALKAQYPDKRLVVVFEPHTFSWRNKNMLYWFDDAFEGAGLVLLYKPAEQGADTHDQSSQEEMLARLVASGVEAHAVGAPDNVMQLLEKNIRESDIVLLSSSGPMDGLIERIPKWLDTRFT
jgi:UDP-N-acetylmuramate: L-alanyl-gamma-D-glutamyl-meso-diaminopimelate ligase